MLKLLVVIDDRAEGTFPEIQECLIERVSLREGLERIATDHFDAVVVHVGRDTHLAMNTLRSVTEAVSLRGFPVMLAVTAPNHATAGLVRATLVHGFVDLRWDPELLFACVTVTIRAVSSESRALEAQDVFLTAALGEAERFQDMAFRDDLTLLSNRRYFERIIDKEHARCHRFGHPYSIVFVDLDNLKEVNLRYGHLVGGQVLEKVGEFIRSITRKCDFAFRFGGDEFVSLLVDTETDGALTYGQRLVEGVRHLDIKLGGVRLNVGASAGIATFPRDGQTGRDLLVAADKAVYAAKAMGKGRVVKYDTSLEDSPALAGVTGLSNQT